MSSTRPSSTKGARRASSAAKYSSKFDTELGGDFVFADHGVAEQAADHGAAEAVVFAEAVAAHGGDAAALDGFGVARQIAIILRVGVSDAADGADAHAVEVGAGFGGVALKIAMQRAIALGDGEFVVGLGEMVHADVVIAGAEEFFEAGAEDAEFFHAFGEMRGEGALLFAQPGHVGVAEQGDAVGSEVEDLLDGVREACRRFGRAGRR